MESKICMGKLMVQYCKGKLDRDGKPLPRDHFNPFCPDKKDPPPPSGAGKAFTNVALTFAAFALYLLL